MSFSVPPRALGLKDRSAPGSYPAGMNPVESRPLRYFVAVAEELNFARAAERLGIASPPLSRAIAQLETQLGVTLLERTTRSVSLTPAGRVLLDEARPALDALDAAARRAQRAAGPRHRLVVALKADMDGGLLEDVMAAYEREQAAIPLEVALGGWREQAQMLRDGRADVALDATPVDAADLDAEALVSEPRLVALAASDPLAGADAITMADLRDAFLPTDEPTVWRGRGHGDLPCYQDLAAMLRFVELGRVVALLPASVCDRYPRPGKITYRSVADAPPAVLSVVWPRRSTSLAVAAFVRAATATAAAATSARRAAPGPGRSGRTRSPAGADAPAPRAALR
jgi:DNA-binding transcriptional LysR family regulator